MTRSHRFLALMHTRVCDATVSQVMAGLGAIAAALAVGLGFIAFSANLSNF